MLNRVRKAVACAIALVLSSAVLSPLSLRAATVSANSASPSEYMNTLKNTDWQQSYRKWVDNERGHSFSLYEHNAALGLPIIGGAPTLYIYGVANGGRYGGGSRLYEYNLTGALWSEDYDDMDTAKNKILEKVPVYVSLLYNNDNMDALFALWDKYVLHNFKQGAKAAKLDTAQYYELNKTLSKLNSYSSFTRLLSSGDRALVTEATMLADGSDVSATSVEKFLARYFGVEKVYHENYGFSQGIGYKDGKYTLGGFGWTLYCWANTAQENIFDNGDGTYTAIVDLYTGNSEYQTGKYTKDVPWGASYRDWYYKATKDWKISPFKIIDGALSDGADIYWTDSCEVVVKPVKYEGMATWQIVSIDGKAAPKAVLAPKTAAPTTAKFYVDGKETAFEAYNIGGNNYFKIRDVAYALRGTNKKFEVTHDPASNTIDITTGKIYTIAGGEMSGKAVDKTALPTSAIVFVDKKYIQISAYNIGGSNFFKLQDVAKYLNFGVGYVDGKVMIESAKNYGQ